ncbi:phosphatase PAP2 family protein [Pediococcus pentosaceus]|jgi:undecaprenyl-diphosphatase|uniref:phosphatase PAP2 family protein n=1 Tax=Pediococcus pentosaceus TaxID=1255 RepID=UPI00338E9DE1
MRKSKTWLIFGIGSLVAFALLSAGILSNAASLQSFDSSIQQFFPSFINPTNTMFMSTFSFFGSPAVSIGLTIIIALAIWLNKNRTMAIWIIFTQIIGSGIAEIVKNIVQRPRPTLQVIKDTGFSYPSGHTFCTAILIMVILFIMVPMINDQEVQALVSILSVLWFVVIAISRIYLRDHFPTDVIGSTLLAISWWEVSRGIYFFAQKHLAGSKLLANHMKGE